MPFPPAALWDPFPWRWLSAVSLTSATAIVTPAAVENYFNVFVAAFIEVPRGCCVTVALKNTSTQAVSIANSNLIVERVA